MQFASFPPSTLPSSGSSLSRKDIKNPKQKTKCSFSQRIKFSLPLDYCIWVSLPDFRKEIIQLKKAQGRAPRMLKDPSKQSLFQTERIASVVPGARERVRCREPYNMTLASPLWRFWKINLRHGDSFKGRSQKRIMVLCRYILEVCLSLVSQGVKSSLSRCFWPL